MGQCFGSDLGLRKGEVPTGGMLVGTPDKPQDPNDPWKDWYYNDYDAPQMVDGRMQSGRWDMSRESFAGKLEEKQRIQADLAKKAELEKANAQLKAQRAQGGAQPAQGQAYRPASAGGAAPMAGGLRAAAPAPAAAPAAAPGQMVQCTVTVVQNEIVPRDTPCVVAARDVPELGLRLRERLRVPTEVTVMGWDADFGEWAQLERLDDIVQQPGLKVKLSAKR